MTQSRIFAIAMAVLGLLLMSHGTLLNTAAEEPDFARNHGALPLDAAAYAKSKEAAAARAEAKTRQSLGTSTISQSAVPIADPSWQGLPPVPSGAPPDPTGAIGPTRYVQLANLSYAIYDRTGLRWAEARWIS